MNVVAARFLIIASSAAVLMLEIVAGRLMAPYLGVSLETFTGIIGVVLAGIAAGAWAGGNLADRPEPSPLIPPLLIAAGALTMAVPTFVDGLGPVMRGGAPLQIVTLTSGAFLLPAAVLSALPPIVVKLRLRSLDETGSVVGSLSAFGTLGALAGTFLTGFVLLAAVPTRPLVLGLGATLIAVGLAMAAPFVTRKGIGASLLGVGALGVTLAQAPGPCHFETSYFCAVIEVDRTRPSGRTLWLDSLAHSYVDLDDPTYLRMRYANVMADVVAMRPDGPLTVAYIGGGGFTLPRYVEAVRAGSSALVFEIDAPLVALAERELGLRRHERLRVETGDARLRLEAQPTGAFQVVIGDAFGGLSVPWHLTTREFVAGIDRVLSADGIYVINVIDHPPFDFARAEMATLRDVFPHVAAIAPAGYFRHSDGGNVVLVASRTPLRRAEIQERIDRRGDGEVVLANDDADRWVADAPVLTDDFAPVDQMLTQR